MPNKELVPLPHLKKSDFLKVITERPATKAQIIEALTGYQYLPSYLDYLIEHFLRQGKIVENVSGISLSRSKKTSGNRVLYKVVKFDNKYSLQKTKAGENGASFEDLIDDGYRLTIKAAVKLVKSEVFMDYKRASTELQQLVDVEDESIPFVATEAEEIENNQ